MAGRLDGKVAFITGAARGQGRAHAVRLAADGADIVAMDLCRAAETTSYPGFTTEDLHETARLVREQGRRVIAEPGDVRDLQTLIELVDRAVTELGGLDIVIANAGICSAAMSWEIPVEKWHETIETNLTGAFLTAKATVPVLIEQGRGGSIVFVSSSRGCAGSPSSVTTRTASTALSAWPGSWPMSSASTTSG
jgi:NAD(P)-dependent dehydrogenase (short-subunit alcohol dehydrogenase family)